MDSKRRLGFGETVCEYAHDFEGGTGLIVSFLRIRGWFNKKLILKTLFYLCEKHPILRVHFKSFKGKFDYFEPASAIATDTIPATFLEKSSEKQWINILESEMLVPFQKNDLQWHITFLLGSEEVNSTHDLILKFHHAIIDGLSLVVFIRDFLLYADCLAAGSLPKITPLPLLPPVETLLAKQTSRFYFFFQQIIWGIKFLWLKKHLFPHELNVDSPKRAVKNLYLKVDKDRLDSLLKKCHKEKTTLTSFLNAALMIAIAKTCDHQGAQIAITPVNLRDSCSPPVSMEYMGFFISFVPIILHQINKNTFIWKLAREYKAKLEKSISTLGYPPAKFIKKILLQSFFLSKKNNFKNFNCGIDVGNLGCIDALLQQTRFHIEEFCPCTSRSSGDYFMLLQSLSLNDKLFLSFIYTVPLISEETAKAVVQNFMSILNDEAGGGLSH